MTAAVVVKGGDSLPAGACWAGSRGAGGTGGWDTLETDGSNGSGSGCDCDWAVDSDGPEETSFCRPATAPPVVSACGDDVPRALRF